MQEGGTSDSDNIVYTIISTVGSCELHIFDSAFILF